MNAVGSRIENAMKRSVVIVALYLALGSDVDAFHDQVARTYRPFRPYYQPACVYTHAQVYNPGMYLPDGYAVYRSYYTPYPVFAGTPYLPEQLRSLPLGWNRYYLASRLQAPYSLIIRNSPPYSGYREVEARPTSSTPPVTVHTVPQRQTQSAPPDSGGTIEISRGMTEDQVKSQLGPPMIQVVLGDTRSYVYDRFVVEFEKGRVKNVSFK